jgi:hypothetical protein
MFIKFLYPVIIVSLPAINLFELHNKLDYTTTTQSFQEQESQNTMEYNYIKSQEFIENNNKKYNKIIP